MTTKLINPVDSCELAAMIQQCNSLIDSGQLEEALTFVSACLKKKESANLYAYKAGIQHDISSKKWDSANRAAEARAAFNDYDELHWVDKPEYSDSLESLRKAITLSPEPEYYYLFAQWAFDMEPPFFKHSVDYNYPRKDSQDQYSYAIEDGKLVLVYKPQNSDVLNREPKLSDSEAYKAIKKAINLDPEVEKYYQLELSILLHYNEFNAALSLITHLKSTYNATDLTGEEVRCLENLGKYNEARQILEHELLPHLQNPDPEYITEHTHELVLLIELMQAQRDCSKAVALLEPIKDFYSKVPKLWNSLYQQVLDVHLLDSKDYMDIIDKIQAGTSKLTPSKLITAMLEDKEFSLLIEALETGLSKDRSFTIFLPTAQKAWMLIWLHTIVGNANKALQAILDFDANSLRISVPPSESMAAEEIDGELYLDSCYLTPYEVHDEILRSLEPFFEFSLPYELMPLDYFKLLLSKFYYKRAYSIEEMVRGIGRKLQINADPYSDNEPSSHARVQLMHNLLVELQEFNTDLPPEHTHFLQFLTVNISFALNRLHELEILKGKEAERVRIISNLSHSIKNLVRSVIDPLHNLKKELPEKTKTIDHALRGANLIRELVNAINSSLTFDIQNFYWDAQHPDIESLSLKDIISAGIVYSIGNMFDFKYFNIFSANYFPRTLSPTEREQIQEQWTRISTSDSLVQVLDFTQNYLFECNIEFSEIAENLVGNAKSSAINLMILFQEIIFNAIKYASFVPRERRYISIKLTDNHDKIKLEVENSYRSDTQARSTGMGKTVIVNFTKALGGEHVITTTNSAYSVVIEFENIWRKNAQDTFH